MTVRVLDGDETGLYRRVRLRALGTDPAAFSSTLEREAGFDDSAWARRLASFGDQPGVVLIDEAGVQGNAGGAVVNRTGRVRGMTGVGLRDPVSAPLEATLWGMWVAPAQRRTGVAKCLLDAAANWASAQGAEAVTLRVMRSNLGAAALYRSFGFVAAMSIEVDDDDPCASELLMRLRLAERPKA